VISSAVRLVPVKIKHLLALSSMIFSRCLTRRSRYITSVDCFIYKNLGDANLVVVVHNLNNLLNVVVGGEVERTNVDLNEIVQEIGGELSDFLGPGSGPHASLSVRANLANNLANLRL
jgi:hypothetical protein